MTLDVVHFSGPHSSKALVAKIHELAGSWAPSTAILSAVVSDGASAVRKAAGELAEEDGLWCFAHQLQLAMQDFTNEGGIADCINAIRIVVAHIKMSSNLLEALSRKQRDANNGAKPLKLLQDVPTRFL